MATFDITVDAQSNIGSGGAGSNAFTEPGDFDGATIDDVSVVGTPTVTSDTQTDDTITIRFNIRTSADVDVFGGPTSNASTLCFAAVGDFQASATIVDGSARSPNPSTAVAADWDQVNFSTVYAPNMKDDSETVSWSSFTIRVTYTPSAGIDPGVAGFMNLSRGNQ